MTQSFLEAIWRRTSIRTYDGRPVTPETRSLLENICRETGTGPFGTHPRLEILDLDHLPPKELRSLGTYGVIRGARLFILGAVKEEPGAMEDLGFCLEDVILRAMSMGLGTCWLAGTFRRSSFARSMNLEEGELLPAITPVGYPARDIRFMEKIAKIGFRSRRRKPWEDLFFHNSLQTPLTVEKSGPYRVVLEAVRRAPSATNKQPWRILWDEGKGLFRLYLAESPLYNGTLGRIKVQNIDMGIAMCHFQRAAEELGLNGCWQIPGLPAKRENLQLIADWKAERGQMLSGNPPEEPAFLRALEVNP